MPADIELVERSKQGDPVAFEELVIMHQKLIYNLAYRMMGNEEDACDVVQEAFLRAFKSLKKFNMKSSFSTWLYRIASNICIDQLRKNKKFRVYPMSYQDNFSENNTKFAVESDDLPEEQAERRETRKRVNQAINKLPEEHRIIVVLRDIQGMSYKEIAEILKLNIGTVKSRINRARLSLKKELQNFEEQIDDKCV